MADRRDDRSNSEATPSPRRFRWHIWWALVANVVVAAVMVLATRGGAGDLRWRWYERIAPVLVLDALFASIALARYRRWYWANERRRRRELADAYAACLWTSARPRRPVGGRWSIFDDL